MLNLTYYEESTINYYDNPPDPEQTSPIEPHNIISGDLPGSTEIRIGNNIKISGKNQQIQVNTTGGNVVIGATSDGRLALEATNNDGSKIGIGDIPGTTNLGLYSVDSSSHTTAVLGKQTDGSNSLKFFDSSNVGLAQFGKFSDGTTALKVARSGIEVGTATSDQLIFNSNQDIFKIVASGTSTVSATNGAASSVVFTNTIAHGLSYMPAFIVFVTPPAGTGGLLEQIPYYFHLYDAVSNSFQVRAMARADIDSTNLSLYVTTNNAALYAGNWVFKYYLLQETAT